MFADRMSFRSRYISNIYVALFDICYVTRQIITLITLPSLPPTRRSPTPLPPLFLLYFSQIPWEGAETSLVAIVQVGAYATIRKEYAPASPVHYLTVQFRSFVQTRNIFLTFIFYLLSCDNSTRLHWNEVPNSGHSIFCLETDR